MSQRISHSLLDPVLTLPMKRWYPWLPLPRQLPPEAIVLTGHALAIMAAVGFAFSTQYWWGGLLIALGVAGNHIADVFDGTHARATGQCRNGGELLDHFFDPLSFAYWLAGLAVSCHQLEMGIAAVICLFATAVLTNIKAKMIGQFTLNSFGPTEFKSLLVLYGGAMAWLATGSAPVAWLTAERVATGFLAILLAVGVVQLVVGLVLSVREVNRQGAPPDTSEWITTRDDGV
ncbi:MAG: CDP-alcohol phosphatidyltransferase family protein [Pirellulaceae bacterium]